MQRTVTSQPLGQGPAADRKASVLFVINSLAGGGAERVFTSLLAASARRREQYQIAVALLDEDPPGHMLPSWIEPFRLDCGHGTARSILRLHRLVGDLKPDLSLSFLTRANIASAFAMAVRGRPCIVSERTNTTAQLAGSGSTAVKTGIVRAAYGRAARVIAVSEGVATELHDAFGIRRERLEVINNPVDVEALQLLASEPAPLEVDRGDVVAMGRLSPEKNFPLALRAFAASRWTGRLILVGQGPLQGELMQLARSLGVADRVSFAGFLHNPYPVIARAGVFMLSSNQEGFSNSLVEAMALRVPVIATDCRFSPAEILDVGQPPRAGSVARGEGGLLIPVGDQASLVLALDQMLDPTLRAQLSAEGTRRVAAFAGTQLFDRYWDVIEQVLEARATSGHRAAAGHVVRMPVKDRS